MHVGEESTEGAGGSPALRWGVFLALSAGWILLGAGLRVARIGEQVFGGDEGHLIWAALEGRFPELLYRYAPADFSLPMAVFARLTLEATGALSDFSLRALPIGFGIGLLIAVATARRLVASHEISLIWLALLAVSPCLIAYSRISRSYGPATALVLLSVLALREWQLSGRARWGNLAGVCAALAVYFHPIVALLPVSSFGVAMLAPESPEPVARRSQRLALLGFATLCGALCALFLLPGLPSLTASVLEKKGRGVLSANVLVEAARLLFGTRSHGVTLCLAVLAGVGLWRGMVRRDALTRFGAGAVATQIGLIAVTSPVGLEGARVLARYALPVWPWILHWTAAGLVVMLSALGERLRVRHLVLSGGMAAALSLIAVGPLVGGDARRSSFLHANELQGFTRPLRSAAGLPVPEPYSRLGEGEGALIEFPLHVAWAQSVAVPSYQRLHGRRVLVARPFFPWNEPELRLAAHVAADPEAFLRTPARFLVVHRDPIAEERRVLAYLKPMARREYTESESLKGAALAMESRLRQAWGDPRMESAEVAVWDLDLVRAARRSEGP